MFFLETSLPLAPDHLQLVRATMNGVEIGWGAVPNANEYLLQIFKVPNVETEQPSESFPSFVY
jgi:host cell factor